MKLTIEHLERAVGAAEDAVAKLERHFERPRFLQLHGSPCFRHTKYNALLMSHLKCVRSVSSLNACLVLLRNGYVQEIGILCRCVDDNNQDVTFLGTPLGENRKISEHQERMLKEFFQEEFDDADPLLSTQKRDRVPRQKVHAGISRLPGQPINPHEAGRVHHSLHAAFSGYVHGAYVHIMEIYGGDDMNSLSYHMHGLLGTPRIPEWTDALSSYVYRTLIAIEIVAKRCTDVTVQQEIEKSRLEFESVTGIGERARAIQATAVQTKRT